MAEVDVSKFKIKDSYQDKEKRKTYLSEISKEDRLKMLEKARERKIGTIDVSKYSVTPLVEKRGNPPEAYFIAFYTETGMPAFHSLTIIGMVNWLRGQVETTLSDSAIRQRIRRSTRWTVDDNKRGYARSWKGFRFQMSNQFEEVGGRMVLKREYGG